MGLFNSLSSQFERLCRAMDDNKTLSLGTAAAAMRIRREKVDAQLARMHKKGLFGGDKPYVDDQLGLVVRDRRYAPLAGLLHAADMLMRAIDQAQQTLRRVYRPTPAQLNSERARAMGNFVRDVVDSAIQKGNAAQVLRSRTGELVRDLISPESNESYAESCRALSQTLALMVSSAAGIRDFALSHPDAHFDAELAQFLLSACRQVEAWNSCGVSAVGSRFENSEAMQTLEKKLTHEYAPGLTQRLDEMHHTATHSAAAIHVHDDPLLKEVHRQCSDLRALSRQLKSPAVSSAMARVNAILDDIQNQLYTVPESRERACVRSLRAVYLPMVQELLEKYIRYESRAGSDETTEHVLRDTEQTLSGELPQALKKLLADLRTEDYMDLEAQTAALRQKMQLDGLLKNDGPST